MPQASARADLVGHSMGSLPVLEAAARHPAHTERAVLLGTSVPMPVADALLDNARANDHAAFDMVTIWGHSRSAQIGGCTVPGIWMTGGGMRLLERGGDGVLYNDMKACNDYTTGLEAAARVRCPTTLILGDGDMMTPPEERPAAPRSPPRRPHDRSLRLRPHDDGRTAQPDSRRPDRDPSLKLAIGFDGERTIPCRHPIRVQP